MSNSENIFSSVIITTFNGEKNIRSTIISVLEQSFQGFELLIIDDGSNDKTKNIIDSFSDSRVKYHHQPNSGHVAAINLGLKLAQSDNILILDHDDLLTNSCLEEKLDVLTQNPNIGVVGSSMDIIDSNGNFLYNIKQPIYDDEIKSKILFQNVISHSGVMYRKHLVKGVGYYDEFSNSAADYDLWLRLLDKTSFVNINKPLVKLRKHISQQTYRMNSNDTLYVLYKNITKLSERERTIYPFVWEIKYGDPSQGRIKYLKNFWNYEIKLFEKIKILFLSLFSRQLINYYYSFHPLHRIFSKLQLQKVRSKIK